MLHSGYPVDFILGDPACSEGTGDAQVGQPDVYSSCFDSFEMNENLSGDNDSPLVVNSPLKLEAILLMLSVQTTSERKLVPASEFGSMKNSEIVFPTSANDCRVPRFFPRSLVF